MGARRTPILPPPVTREPDALTRMHPPPGCTVCGAPIHDTVLRRRPERMGEAYCSVACFERHDRELDTALDLLRGPGDDTMHLTRGGRS